MNPAPSRQKQRDPWSPLRSSKRVSFRVSQRPASTCVFSMHARAHTYTHIHTHTTNGDKIDYIKT